MSGWDDWCAQMDAEVTKVSYAPLGPDAVPAIEAIARMQLTNVVMTDHDIRCRCPMHDGGREGQTLRINLRLNSVFGVGFWHCHSCKRSGHWNKLALHLGVDPLSTNPELAWIETDVDFALKPAYTPPPGLLDWPAGYNWVRRNKDGSVTEIPAKVFELVGAKLWHTRGRAKNGCWMDEIRAWLPVCTRSGVHAHVAALLSDRYDGAVKYLNSPGPWAHAYIAMHAAALELAKIVGTSTLCIVEGSADALRLLGYGVPAVPLLGVGNWSDAKTSIVAASWERAVVCLDGDEAGRSAQQDIIDSLHACVSVDGVVMPVGKDPADLDPRLLRAALAAVGVHMRAWNV